MSFACPVRLAAVAVFFAALAGCSDEGIIGAGQGPCTSSKDCAGLICDSATSTCVECMGDADCLDPGTFCAGKLCAPVIPCESDKQCPGAVCNTTLGRCVDCVDGGDCPSAAPFCVLHVCSAAAGSSGGDGGIVVPDGGSTDSNDGKPDPKPDADVVIGGEDTGPFVPPETCTTKDECNDGDPCTKESCSSNECVYGEAVGVPCDDGDACTSEDACQKGTGCTGTFKECEDGNPCTFDGCDPDTGGCVYDPMDGGDCDDENTCTTDDACEAGKCKGVGLDCDDDNPCTKNDCAPGGDKCANTKLETGTPCDDGSICTDNDFCKDGGCIGVSDKCDDGNPCSLDSCDGVGKCTHSPMSGPCNDGDLCTVDDVCEFNECRGDDADCSDGNQCTKDVCDPVLGCVYEPISGIFCSDGDLCTDQDICKDGKCVGTPANCDDLNPCTEDVCTPSGTCAHPALTSPPGDPFCDDGKACTEGDHCQSGTCTGVWKECAPDGNPCTSDSCDLATGACYKVVPATCNDGNDCTQSDTCATIGGSGKCIGTPKNSGACFGKDGAVWQCKSGQCMEPTP